MPLNYRLVHRVHHDLLTTPTGSRWRRRARPVPQSPSRPEVAELPRAPEYRAGGLVVDCGTRRVSVDGRQLELTCMEFELIAHFVAHPHRVYTRRQLMELVWQQRATGDMRTVDVHIARLRRKLGRGHRALIRTVRQVGYAFDPPPATASPAAEH
ncbi:MULTISPECIES: winged helix-turn-helix domain-containing protein [unclassified Streptomyces]|uniref:winged helix-turn-helix domain-containing protein n=1 Tax=unclassified Streptomyces TaxID=2593676 RepID=UPI0037F2AA16